MQELLKAVFASWTWRPEVLLVVVALGGAYTSGWRSLRRRGHQRLARSWRLALYLAGLAALVLALLSPIHHLASLLLTAHMVQHLLLTMVAAPLLLLGNPFPVCLWGLPRTVRRPVGRLLSRDTTLRKVLWALTLMPVAWLCYVGTLWIWHTPAVYDAALRHHLLHDLEHVAFFGTALLFWWPIIEPAPRLHARLPLGFVILYLGMALGQNTLLGASIALPERVLYSYYDSPPRLFGLSPLDDQAFAGSLMWTSGHMYLLPILLVVAKRLGDEEWAMRQREAAQRSRRR